MKLIADSGSSKTDWALIHENKVMEYTSTVGFNPFFHQNQYIQDEILKNNLLQFTRLQITDIQFFGAGCSSPDRNEVIHHALKSIFQNANITVDHDIAGAVYATCGHEKGISCIIGTGSNCVYSDGKKIHHFTQALGYILGDEGSGSFLGKIIARDAINNDLPAEVKAHIEKQVSLDKETILDAVYKKPNANKYLASIAKPLFEIRTHPYVKNIITEGFSLFVERHIKKIPLYQQVPAHFVGSIASLYHTELQEVCSKNNIQMGKVIQKPIEGLADHFLAIAKKS